MHSGITSLPVAEVLRGAIGLFGIGLDEAPRFEVLERDGDIEVRRYAPALVAEITVSGPRSRAVDEAVRKLEGYLFGHEHPLTGLLELGPRPSTPTMYQGRLGRWRVPIFVSNDVDLASAPVPRDEAIELIEEPARIVAVTHLTGEDSEPHRAEARERIASWLRGNPRYRRDASVYWSRYDAPFVVPFVESDEAQVELQLR